MIISPSPEVQLAEGIAPELATEGHVRSASGKRPASVIPNTQTFARRFDFYKESTLRLWLCTVAHGGKHSTSPS